jgi:hypothetical protein
MAVSNTLNICLGHVPFPVEYREHVDLMIAPNLVLGPYRVAVVPDSLFGPNGSALSEYAQLLWLSDNFDAITSGADFVRIFQYRRFVSEKPLPGVPSTNQPWSMTITAGDLASCGKEFDRFCGAELFNRPVRFDGGMLMQYASAHVLEDMLSFVKFLLEIRVFDPRHAAAFLNVEAVIPACNMGTFRKETLRSLLLILKRAAEFLKSSYFVPREGYQRRNMGFLLERLHSFAILQRVQSAMSPRNFGNNIVISESPVVSLTM